VEIMAVNADFWRGRRVLITGHTGFKGAWLCLLLHHLGAKVSGLSLGLVGSPDMWSQLHLDQVSHNVGDVRDADTVRAVLSREQPEIVFHLAAQSLVRRAYRDPAGTFSTNVLGVVTLLQAISQVGDVQACVVVTSDKCYEIGAAPDGYREADRLGGDDPYSASKGCAELATASMRHSFFRPAAPGGHACRIASARSGNVIGGGDWSPDRLIPDIVRGCTGATGRVSIRSPHAVRPWQHVLDPLHGYLLLAETLVAGTGAEGWNFGPDRGDERDVIEVARAFVHALGQGQIDVAQDRLDMHETAILRLDSTKARQLGWAPRFSLEKAVDLTADWYRDWLDGAPAHDLTLAQIKQNFP
jgi:CDP-glucose 4,6-dehydratase